MEVNTSTTTDPLNMYNFLNNWILNPIVIVIIVVIIVAYVILFTGLGNKNESSNISSISSSGENNNEASKILGIIVIVILLILIIINAFQYFFSINVTAYIQGLFSPTPQIDIVVNETTPMASTTVPEIKFMKQVFNIPGNYYNYKDAKAICNAYGSELATYQQIESSYENGSEWCNYGWSDGQLALFPTQQTTYDQLQTIEGHENDCGRPGINGGYIANPNVRFGVNCYGYKPEINSEEEELMKNTTPYPESKEDIELERKVDYWKTKVDEILVSPFNYNTWSEI
jgi:hypothetical protein